MDPTGLGKQTCPKVFPQTREMSTKQNRSWRDDFFPSYLTFLFKLNKTPPTLLKMTALCFLHMSSDIRQKQRSLNHLCCDYWRHDFSSPSSKDLHSTHSCSLCPDCFHIHAGNSATPVWVDNIKGATHKSCVFSLPTTQPHFCWNVKTFPLLFLCQ